MTGQTLRVRCAVPPDAACSASPRPASVRELGAAFALDVEGQASLRVRLSARSRGRPGGRGAGPRVAICVGVRFKADDIATEYPDALVDWLQYHYRAGVGRFYLYDTDGSLSKHLPSWMVRAGIIAYHPKFPARFGRMADLSSQGWPQCTEVLAYDHCLYHNMGDADWIHVLHSFDVYTFVPDWASLQSPAPLAGLFEPSNVHRSAPIIPRVLERIGQRAANSTGRPVCGIFIRQLDFGGPREPSSHLARSFSFLEEQDVARPLPQGRPGPGGGRLGLLRRGPPHGLPAGLGRRRVRGRRAEGQPLQGRLQVDGTARPGRALPRARRQHLCPGALRKCILLLLLLRCR
ncbi:unnamed protein product [Prorocentrum cordatum]|uniref:Glycosyltransferase family 92 protein n=1 Tax=Prorocentrum cordatum TaxID=2364126 RepID=A0ABN9RDG9_9DINO|nr:unnamed protein product [Polarella glacialis]